MPITKKKGAIFAIYTDSPARSTRSQTTNVPQLALSTISTQSTSPTKKSNLPRKALSAVQPKSVGFPSEPLTRLDKGKARATGPDAAAEAPSTTKSSTNPKSISRATAPNPITTKRTTIASKRQFEIFSAPSVPPSPTLPTNTSRHAESPVKKTRATPRKPIVENKENTTPLVDSPASRTRSKVLSTPSASLASPIQALRLTSRTSRAGVESLVGDGKGTFTLKKGRAVAKLMQGPEVFAGDDVLGDVSEAYGAEGSAPSGFETQRR